MLYILYQAGRHLKDNYKITSKAGIVAIIVYTLNEGLRFGRGVDYNMGGRGYEKYATFGGDYNNHVGFEYLVKLFVELNIPWQGCVLFMSCMFIIGLLFFLKQYREVVSYALPIFVLVSSVTVENLFKWYLAFSFFMIGLYYQIEKERGVCAKYIIFSCLSCLFHTAFIPVPFIFYLLSKIQKPLLHPFISIALFFSIVFLFQTSFMLNFVELFNTMAMLSDRLSAYSDSAESYLTEGFQGRETSAMPGISELSFLLYVITIGYKCVVLKGQRYVFVYNLFLLGFLLRPITNQIPLFGRYDNVLFFFRAIVFACIIQVIYIEKQIRIRPILSVLSFLIIGLWITAFIRRPFNGNPKKYLYVWNRGKISYDEMISTYSDDANKKSDKLKKTKRQGTVNLFE